MSFNLFLLVSVLATFAVKSHALGCYQANFKYRVAWPQYDNNIDTCRNRCNDAAPRMSSLLRFNNDVCFGADGWADYATSQFGYYVKGTDGCGHLVCECEVERVRWRVHKNDVGSVPCDKDSIAARIESTAGPVLNAFPYKAIWIFTTNDDVHCGSQRRLQDDDLTLSYATENMTFAEVDLSLPHVTENITIIEGRHRALPEAAAQSCVHGLN